MANRIIISGNVVIEPEYSHRKYGDEMYMFTISSRRLSGTEDFIPVLIHKRKLCEEITYGNRIKVIGEIRTHSFIANGENRTCLLVLANEIDEPEEMDENYVELDGWMCKEPFYKKTTLTRKRITDFMVSSKRNHGSNDYIPCIVWSGCAGFARHLDVGTYLALIGRLQSREYQKTMENGEIETRVVYEVSARSLDVLDWSEENG